MDVQNSWMSNCPIHDECHIQRNKSVCFMVRDILMTNYDHHELSFHFDSNSPLGFYHSPLLLILMSHMMIHH
jgi:hypothetical protein